jgi:hypothetical protein
MRLVSKSPGGGMHTMGTNNIVIPARPAKQVITNRSTHQVERLFR